jgi:hypothetical protein
VLGGMWERRPFEFKVVLLLAKKLYLRDNLESDFLGITNLLSMWRDFGVTD